MINYSVWRYAAQRAGISNSEFWQLTPSELLTLLGLTTTTPALSRQEFKHLLKEYTHD